MPSPHLHPCTKPWTRCTQLQNVLNEITRDSGRIGWRPSCAERAIRRCCWGIAQSGLPRNRCAHGWWETTGKSLGSPLPQSCDGYAAYSRRPAEIGRLRSTPPSLKAKMELRGGPQPPGKTSAARPHLANSKPQGQGAFGGTRIPGRQRGGQAQKLPREVGPTPKNGPPCGRFCGLFGVALTTRSARGKVLSG
jgi:hypothetical protein